jgi:hypothetical protein
VKNSPLREDVPMWSRLYLPYCVASSRSELRSGLRVDAIVWIAVLLVALAHVLLRLI